MAGDEEHVDELGSEATVHGSMNQEHLGVAGVLANSSRPRRRVEGRAEAAVAMAGEAEVVGAPENGHTRHHLPKETVGEGEEGTTNLTTGKMEVGKTRGRRTTRRGGRRTTAIFGAAVAASEA